MMEKRIDEKLFERAREFVADVYMLAPMTGDSSFKPEDYVKAVLCAIEYDNEAGRIKDLQSQVAELESEVNMCVAAFQLIAHLSVEEGAITGQIHKTATECINELTKPTEE